MGLFERMKLAGKEVVTEEAEPLKDGQLPILEKTASLVVEPSRESSLLGKRRAEVTAPGVLDPAIPSMRRSAKEPRKGLGAPGLKPRVAPLSSHSRGSSSSTEGSDSSSGSDPSVRSGNFLFIYFYLIYLLTFPFFCL
jgi:hypothetical protein